MNITLPKPPDKERWGKMSFVEQMANISSEIGRTGKWKMKGNKDLAESAFIRLWISLTQRFPKDDETLTAETKC